MKVNGARSTIDHFLVSGNSSNYCINVSCEHAGDNLSDHSVVYGQFEILFDYVKSDNI